MTASTAEKILLFYPA